MDARLPIFISSFYRLVYNISFFFWFVYLLSVGLSPTQSGVVLAVSSVFGLLASMPSGFANDRYSSRKILDIGLGLFALQFIMLLFGGGFFWHVVAFALAGIGNRLIDVSIDSYILKLQQEDVRSPILAYFILLRFVGIALGMAIGGSVAVWAETQLFTDLFGVTGFVAIMIASLFGILILFLSSLRLQSDITVAVKFKAVWQHLLDPEILFFLGGFTLFALHFGAEQVAYVAFLTDFLQLDMQQAGLYMAGAIFLMGIAGFIFSRLVEKGFPLGYLLLGGMLQSGIFHILMTTDIVGHSFIFRAVHEIGDAAVFTFMFHGFTRLFPQKFVASNYGILTFLIYIATAVGLLVYGGLEDAGIGSVSLPLVASGWLLIIVAVLMGVGLLFMPQVRKKLFT